MLTHVVEIKEASIQSGRLWGVAKNHPKFPTDTPIVSGPILEMNSHIIQTKNTLYSVMSWDKPMLLE